jgi:hypothetical protein
MKRVVDKLVKAGRIAVVMVALMALVVSGAEAAERLFRSFETPRDASLPEAASLDHNPAPEDATDQMAPDGRPWTEQAAYIQASLAVPVGPDQHRQAYHASVTTGHVFCPDLSGRNGYSFATTALVDVRIGHRFTLVGSKPSGTS